MAGLLWDRISTVKSQSPVWTVIVSLFNNKIDKYAMLDENLYVLRNKFAQDYVEAYNSEMQSCKGNPFPQNDLLAFRDSFKRRFCTEHKQTKGTWISTSLG